MKERQEIQITTATHFPSQLFLLHNWAQVRPAPRGLFDVHVSTLRELLSEHLAHGWYHPGSDSGSLLDGGFVYPGWVI